MRTRAYGGTRAMLFPNKAISPAEGLYRPLMRLKRVVLPAPLGPRIAMRVPTPAVIETSWTARIIPNDLLRPAMRRAGDGRGSSAFVGVFAPSTSVRRGGAVGHDV